jgi:alkaline phosphatase D
MQRRPVLALGALLVGCSSQTATILAGPAPVAEEPGRLPERDVRVPLSRIALVSCIDQTEPQSIWRSVLQAQPELVVFAGDNVYASQQPWTRAQLDAAYAQQARNPDFVRLRRSVPALAIWDDHDYGVNDGGAEFPYKESSKAAFLDFWQVPPDSDRRRRDGLYFAYTFGPPGQRMQVILLDTRWFRSSLKASPQRGTPGMERYVPDADPSKTMLGDAQWRWLGLRLKEKADVRLVVSSIQVLAEGHGYERWGNLPLERQRLFDTVARSGAQGVIFASGDRHIGGLYKLDHGTPYPLLEITSSGVTHTARQNREPGPRRLGDPVTELHFGWVEIDWATHMLSLGLRGQNGQVLREHRVPLSSLQAP